MWFRVAVVTVVLHCGEFVRAETITLRSGNGSVGGTDSLITMLVGPADTWFASAFTPSDFADARSGPAAFIISPNGAWISDLPSDNTAQWISTSSSGASEGSTALYAIDFTLTDPAASATLDLKYSVDNVLGGGGAGPTQGVYLNGMPISGSSIGGDFLSEYSITRSDIAPLLAVGTNTLYINATDVGGPAGLIFSATIETTPIPEPVSLTILGSGLAGLCFFVRKRRRGVSTDPSRFIPSPNP